MVEHDPATMKPLPGGTRSAAVVYEVFGDGIIGAVLGGGGLPGVNPEFTLDGWLSPEGNSDVHRWRLMACNCILSTGEVLPWACHVHGFPCEDCGGVEGCTPECAL